jgi:hypothetical protein
MPVPTRLYRLMPVEAPWGDYGQVLMHGLSTRLDRQKGLIQLERTGPTIAPITSPNDNDRIVTQDFQLALEQSGLTGFSFQPVIKRHIVDLDWEEWDITADGPEELPEDDVASNYILRRPHETRAADELGILFEMVLAPGIEARIDEDDVLHVKPESWNGTDFFHATEFRIPCVSAKARAWIEHHAGDYVEFGELKP